MRRKIHVPAQGEMHLLKSTINDMVDRLDHWSLAVSRVARDVGVDGKMGQQAETDGITGRWKEITVDVNIMAQVCPTHSLLNGGMLTGLRLVESHLTSPRFCRHNRRSQFWRLFAADNHCGLG